MKRWKAIWIAMLFAAATHRSLAQDAPRVIEMTAKKYEFSPAVINVKKGEHIKLVITASDREHGIKIDAFHVDKKLPKGEPVTVEFTADRAGAFPFQCSKFCGTGHGKMKGQIIVE